MLITVAILVGGCSGQPDEPPSGSPTTPPETITIPPPPENAGHPEGREGLRWLTDAEKEKVIEIALNTPEASKWLEEESEYRIGEVEWYAIEDSGAWHRFPYDYVETNPNYQLVPESAVWYPGVTIAVGEDTITQMQIAVDLETEKAVMVLGPYPSLGSPDRFRP